MPFCRVERVKTKTQVEVHLGTGAVTTLGTVIVVEPCNAPLFRGGDICEACIAGWEVPGNRLSSRGVEAVCAAWGAAS